MDSAISRLILAGSCLKGEKQTRGAVGKNMRKKGKVSCN